MSDQEHKGEDGIDEPSPRNDLHDANVEGTDSEEEEDQILIIPSPPISPLRGPQEDGAEELQLETVQRNDNSDGNSRNRRTNRSSSFQRFKQRMGWDPTPEELVQEHGRRLHNASELLLERMFRYLSRLPEEQEEGEDDPLGRRSSTAPVTGITLPASALAWLSSQIYPPERTTRSEHDQDGNNINNNNPYNPRMLSIPEQSPQPLWMGIHMRDRLALLKFLLPRMTHLRIVGNVTWPPSVDDATMTQHVKQRRQRQQRVQMVGQDLSCSHVSVNSALTTDSMMLPLGASNDHRASVPTLEMVQDYLHQLQYQPKVDARLFPRLQVLVLEQVPANWILNLHVLSRTLQVMRLEKGCIYNVNSFLFPPRMSEQTNDTNTAEQQRRWLVYSQLTHLKLSRCGLDALSGLRPDRNGQLGQPAQPLSPSPLARFPQLQVLSLSHNELSWGRDALAGLRSLMHLKKLDLSYNQFRGMPNIYRKVGNLQYLNLMGNQLTSTVGIDRLYSLQILDLRDNRLESIGSIAGLGRLPELNALFLHGNPLTSNKGNRGSRQDEDCQQHVPPSRRLLHYSARPILRRKKKSASSYRVDIWNLFAQQRIERASGSRYNIPLREELKHVLPRLDGKIPSSQALKQLEAYQFSEHVSTDTIVIVQSHSTSNADAEIVARGTRAPVLLSAVRVEQEPAAVKTGKHFAAEGARNGAATAAVTTVSIPIQRPRRARRTARKAVIREVGAGSIGNDGSTVKDVIQASRKRGKTGAAGLASSRDVNGTSPPSNAAVNEDERKPAAKYHASSQKVDFTFRDVLLSMSTKITQVPPTTFQPLRIEASAAHENSAVVSEEHDQPLMAKVEDGKTACVKQEAEQELPTKTQVADETENKGENANHDDVQSTSDASSKKSDVLLGATTASSTHEEEKQEVSMADSSKNTDGERSTADSQERKPNLQSICGDLEDVKDDNESTEKEGDTVQSASNVSSEPNLTDEVSHDVEEADETANDEVSILEAQPQAEKSSANAADCKSVTFQHASEGGDANIVTLSAQESQSEQSVDGLHGGIDTKSVDSTTTEAADNLSRELSLQDKANTSSQNRKGVASIRLYADSSSVHEFDIFSQDWDDLVAKASQGLILNPTQNPLAPAVQSRGASCSGQLFSGAFDLLDAPQNEQIASTMNRTKMSSKISGSASVMTDSSSKPSSFPDLVYEDDLSVPSSLGASRDEILAFSKFQLAEENSAYDGPSGCRGMKVLENLELYFRSFVFAPPSTDSLSNLLNAPNEDEDDWQQVLLKYPKLQLWREDRLWLEANSEDMVAVDPMSSLDLVDSRETMVHVWRETVIPCGKLSMRRLLPRRSQRLGFHGDLLFRKDGPDTYTEARNVILCLSSSAFYVILDDDAVTKAQKGKKKKFPRPLQQESLFRDAVWPHAVARHPIGNLKKITIGFSFQRLTLHFSNPAVRNGEYFSYILLTSNKLSTISLLKDIQNCARTASEKFESASVDGSNGSDFVPIENDDRNVLEALAAAIAPEIVGIVLHYQILRQRWKHGDRGAVRRACIITDTKMFLLDEDYNGDGSPTLPIKSRDFGQIRYKLVDEASLQQIAEVQAANADPKAMTIVINPLSRLSRTRRWRLVCKDSEGAEKLVADIRKAIAMAE